MLQKISMIIAGSTGLVGEKTLKEALNNEGINHIFSLSRSPVKQHHHKLTKWVDANLTPPENPHIEDVQRAGVIALGSTKKQAGSKQRLQEIDVDLVIKVAKQMQQLGVQHLIVVSCLNASKTAPSHYLRCKGEMEYEIEKLAFQQITFMQPGPLAGRQHKTRPDEKLLVCALKIISPLMLGKLANYKAIQGNDVAKAIIHLALSDKMNSKKVKRVNRTQMLELISESPTHN